MENKSIRLRTTPGSSKNIMVKIDQEFDFLEVLSLKISQEELYSSFCASYGVVIGRVIANKGFGLPNAKVSIFVPISSEDEKNVLLKELYPYKSVLTKNSEGKRYNLLLSKSTCSLNNQALGSFPTKNEILDNDIEIEIFEKYYKYTTKTNNAGDYMIFGIPVGTHVVHMDIDLSDSGTASIRPYDLISDGFPKNLFQSPTEFKISNNLDTLPQIKSGNIGTDVIPFWGDEGTCEVGITRIDFDTNFNITPNSIFFGSIFTDDGKMSLNKGCNPKNKMGSLDRLRTAAGEIKTLRVSSINNADWVNTGDLNPTAIEEFKLFNPDPSSKTLIDDDGNFAVTVPNNIGHMITNEFGELVASGDPDVGVATKGMYRFAMKFNEPPTNVKRRTAVAIFPSLSALHGGTGGKTSNVPITPSADGGTEDQRFTTNISDYPPDSIHLDFQTFEWKQIYTISQFIKKYKKGTNKFSFLGLKNTDTDNSGGFNPMPYTTAIWKGSIIYGIFSFFVTLASAILQFFVFLVILQFGFAFQLGMNKKLLDISIGIGGCCHITLRFCFGLGVHIRPFGFLSAVFPRFDKNDDGCCDACDAECYCDVGCAPCVVDGDPGRGFTLDCDGDAMTLMACVNMSDPCPSGCGNPCTGTLTNATCCEPLTQTDIIAIRFGTASKPKGCLCATPLLSTVNGVCAYSVPNPDSTCEALEAIKDWACCVKINSAEKNETMRRCFFDAWLTGSAYLFQFKYKGKVSGSGVKTEKFCGPGSDTYAGDNYKRNQCCPNGQKGPYKDDLNNSGVATPSNENSHEVCPRCLLRGPGATRPHQYNYVGHYHQHLHNDITGTVGAKDLDDIVYCNAYYSTKIVNLGRIEMCEDVLFEIEKCITAPSCNIDQYEQLYPDISNQNIENGVGTGYELSWDQNIWLDIMQETSYQSPVEIFFYLLRCKTPTGEKGGCQCFPKQLFWRSSGCHERELRAEHKNVSNIHPYDLVKELSKIYTEITLTSSDNICGTNNIGEGYFIPGMQAADPNCYDGVNPPQDPCPPSGGYTIPELDPDTGNPITSGLQFELGLGRRFSPCGNDVNTGEMKTGTAGTKCANNPSDNAWYKDYQVIGRPNAIKNIPYFYFGLIAGKTSINKVRNLFFQNR